MNKLKLSIISYIIAIILFIIYLYYLFMPKLSMDPSEKAIFLLFVCIFNYFGSLFLTKYLNNNKPLKINLKVSLILYIFLLIDLVIFDFERGEITLIFNNESWQSYIDIFVNLVPFKTIKRFFNAFGRINSRYLIYNLLGNLICLMPLSLLLPKIYKVQNKFFIFTITILLTTLAIEVTQLITCTGFFDIDDIILNASGALIAYLILKIKPLARSTSKIFLLERSNYEKINIFALINSILLFLFVIIGVCYDKYATITKIFSKPQLLILFPILIIVFYYFLKFIYSFFHNYKPREKANYPKIITFIFYRHPFLSMSIFTILISSLYLVFFYPGTMSFDGNWQLNSYFHYWTWNDHHPALLSIIMANILKFGNSILDANFGIFLFILIELIINGLVYGYVLNIMNKLNSPLILRVITFIFLSLFPLWSINSITYIKDTIYYLVFLFIFTFTYYHFYILKEYKLKTFLF